MLLSPFSPLFSQLNSAAGTNALLQKSPGLVLQRLTTPEGVFGGLICTASVEDLGRGRILPHEEILTERFVNIAASLQKDMTMSEPILLGYPTHPEIGKILGMWIEKHAPEITRIQGKTVDDYWHIDDFEIVKKVLSCFTEIEHLYVADGHHRLGAVKHLFETGVLATPHFLAACYSFKNLNIHAYHRSVQATDQEATLILDKLRQLGNLSSLEDFVDPHLPTQIVVQQRDHWFLWSATDFDGNSPPEKILPASLFEETVLDQACGITDVKASDRITYYPDNEQKEMSAFVRQRTDQLGFYLSPVLPTQFMHFCRHGLMMPPKSTYFTPRMPKDAVYQILES